MDPQRNGSESGPPEAEIARIAGQIARALPEPPADGPRDDSLAARHELLAADSDRVIAALLARRRAGARGCDRGQEPGAGALQPRAACREVRATALWLARRAECVCGESAAAGARVRAPRTVARLVPQGSEERVGGACRRGTVAELRGRPTKSVASDSAACAPAVVGEGFPGRRRQRTFRRPAPRRRQARRPGERIGTMGGSDGRWRGRAGVRQTSSGVTRQ